MHLCADVTDSICTPGCVVAVRRDGTRHGGGVLILALETILFEEVDIYFYNSHAELVVMMLCYYHQPSSTDTTLLMYLPTHSPG